MKIQKKIQKGIMLIEVIAVLGLIAAVTPMLTQQISRRNDDVLNVQIATEMRAAKEALAAYIKANESNIARECGLVYSSADAPAGHQAGDYKPVSKANGGYVCYTDGDSVNSTQTLVDAIEDYFSGDDGVLDAYDFIVSGYTVKSHTEEVTTSTGTTTYETYRPVIFGTVHQHPLNNGTEAPQNLKNAAKIASLIGLDGGVVVNVDGEPIAQGMQGSWSMGMDIVEVGEKEATSSALHGVPTNTVVAITLFDEQTNSAILKDVKIEHFKGVTMTTNQALATEGMAVGQVFSVGDLNCVNSPGNPDMTIGTTGDAILASDLANQGYGQFKTCFPFFQVTKDGAYLNNGVIKTGIVYESYIKNQFTGATIKEFDAGASGIYDINLAGDSHMNDIVLASLGNVSIGSIMPKWSLMAVLPSQCLKHGSRLNLCTVKNVDSNNYGMPCDEETADADLQCTCDTVDFNCPDIILSNTPSIGYCEYPNQGTYTCTESTKSTDCPCDVQMDPPKAREDYSGTDEQYNTYLANYYNDLQNHNRTCTKTCVTGKYCVKFSNWACPPRYKMAFIAIPGGKSIGVQGKYTAGSYLNTNVGSYFSEIYGTTTDSGTLQIPSTNTGYLMNDGVSGTTLQDKPHSHTVPAHTHAVFISAPKVSISDTNASGVEQNIDFKEEHAMSCHTPGEYYIIYSYCVSPLGITPYAGSRWDVRYKCHDGTYFDPMTASCKVCPDGKKAPAGAVSAALCINACAVGQYADLETLSCRSCPENSTSTAAGAFSIDDCRCVAGYHRVQNTCVEDTTN